MLVLTAFVGMTANVSAQEQPVADAGGPYLNFECYPITLDASGSYDPDNDLLTYRWYIDGFWYDNGGSPQYEWTWLDDYSGEITLEVSDGLDTSLDTAEVMIVNVPPQNLTIDAPSEVDVDTEFFVFVSFFDGLPDPRGFIASLDSYTATFSWGDGSSDVFNLGVEEFMVSASHAYAETGSYEITITIIDDDGGEAIGTWIILVDATMALVEAGPDGIIDEGSEFISAGYLADDEGTYTALVDYGDGTEAQELLFNLGNAFDLQHQYCDNGLYSVIVNVFNEGEEWGSDSATVTVSNVPPTIESLTGPPMDPVQLGTPITLTGVFSDPGCLDTHIAMIEWGDGETTTMDVPFGTYLVTASHTYAAAGVYQITLTVTDDDGGSDSETLQYYVVIYDPSAGFVTGGGWIIAQPGSYPADPTLTGKATFGFVSKYKKGQSIPTGNTEFQFHAAGMNFHSHTYEWLVIAGAKAMYQGVGTINGEGNYQFKLTAIDGQKNGGGGVDKFRIKIWDLDNSNELVFDNNLGMSDDDDPVTALSGGQITIHKN